MIPAQLKVYLKDEELESIDLDKTLLIGRKEGCDVQLDDKAISREHAFLKLVDDGIEIKRRTQFGKLKVNGKDVTQAIISSKDIVEIGPYKLKVSPESITQNIQPIAQVKTQPEPVVSSVSLSIPASVIEPVSEPASAIAEISLAKEEEAPVHQESKVLESFQSNEVPFQFDDSPSLEKNAFKNAQQTNSLILEGKNPFDTNSVKNMELQSLSNIFENTKNNEIQNEIPTNIGIVQPTPSIQGTKIGVSTQAGISENTRHIGNQDKTKAQSISSFQVVLKVLKGELPFSDFQITKDRIVLGRSSRCDIVLAEKKCSRENTEIFRLDNRYFIKDLGSSNGTRVNGIRIEETQLFGNEVIAIGDTEFKFEVIQKNFGLQKEDIENAAEQLADIVDFKTRSRIQPILDPLDGMTRNTQSPGYQNTDTQRILGVHGSGVDVKKLNLYEKVIHELKENKRARLLLIAMAALYFLIEEDVVTPQKTPVATTQVVQKENAIPDGPKKKVFEALTAEEKSFVVKQHELAFAYYSDGKYDDAILEIDKIFQYVDDYNNAKNIRRYSLEGKRIQESKEEERIKAEKQKKLLEEIKLLETKAEEMMVQKKFDLVEEIFSEILSRQPENEKVVLWRKDIEAFHEEEKRKELEKQDVEKINENIKNLLAKAEGLKTEGKLLEALEWYHKVVEMKAPDASLGEAAQLEINAIEEKLNMTFDSFLQEGKTFEESGELAQAYKKYEEADSADPRRKEGKEGMRRVFGVLEDKAKVIYTEAIVSESLSDFAQAKKKFNEIVEMAPRESIYFERAQRKLERYKNFNF